MRRGAWSAHAAAALVAVRRGCAATARALRWPSLSAHEARLVRCDLPRALERRFGAPRWARPDSPEWVIEGVSARIWNTPTSAGVELSRGLPAAGGCVCTPERPVAARVYAHTPYEPRYERIAVDPLGRALLEVEVYGSGARCALDFVAMEALLEVAANARLWVDSQGLVLESDAAFVQELGWWLIEDGFKIITRLNEAHARIGVGV